jgi:hypothetical protein
MNPEATGKRWFYVRDGRRHGPVEVGDIVGHILAGGRLESHDATMERLLDVVGLPQSHQQTPARHWRLFLEGALYDAA